MGLKSGSLNYGGDNPLIALRDNMESLAATGVLKLITEQPERAAEILEHFKLDSDPDVEKHADDFLHNAVETLMKVADYESLVQIVQEAPAHEDFNPRLKPNYREQDFDRKWRHSRTGVKTEPLDEITEDEAVSADFSDTVIANEQLKSFWKNLSDEDKKLLQMKMAGASQKEIATALGLRTQSAVSKRLAKLKEQFIAQGG
jgi:DNA-binding NarL/FixJ family response regulator